MTLPPLALALWQEPGLCGAPDTMLDRLEARLAAGGFPGRDLLILPELWVGGYMDPLAVRASAEPREGGPAFARLATLARTHHIAIAYGYAERDGDALYNAARLIGPDGAECLHYRKVHLWGPYERELFVAGDCPSAIASLGGWQIGFSICYDTEFPETLRDLALRGAQLVIAPAAVGCEFPLVAEAIIRVRAAENGLFLAYANRAGTERDYAFGGASALIDPEGAVLARATAETATLTATLDPAAIATARARNPYLAERRWSAPTLTP